MAREKGVKSALVFLSKEVPFAPRATKVALLVKAQELFEEADNPAYFSLGLSFAKDNFFLNRSAEAQALWWRVFGYTRSSADQALRDKIRYELVLIYIQTNRETDAFQTAKMIEAAPIRFAAFREVVEALAYGGVYNPVKNILLNDYLPAARAVTGCELCPGKVDYTNRAEQLTYIAGKLAEIGEATAAAEIKREIAGLAGSFFSGIHDPYHYIVSVLNGRFG